MKLEEKIMTLRKKQGWSQEELAFRLDVSRQAVSKWEMGSSIPDLDKIIKMSEIFGVTTDYLLKDDAQEETPNTGNTYSKNKANFDKESDEDGDDEYDEEGDEEKDKKWTVKITRKSGKEAVFNSLFSCIILAVYLGVSLWTGRWDITWIIWLLYGPMEVIVRTIFAKKKESELSPEKKEKLKKILRIYEEIYWPVIVAVYLGVSILTKRWGITWIIWIIAIFLDALCSSILRTAIAKEDKNEDNENE